MGGCVPADFWRWHHRRDDAHYRCTRPAVFLCRFPIRVAQSRLRGWIRSTESEFRPFCLLSDRFRRRSLDQSSPLDAELVLSRRDRVSLSGTWSSRSELPRRAPFSSSLTVSHELLV